MWVPSVLTGVTMMSFVPAFAACDIAYPGIVVGLKPDEIRGMIPKDLWLVFEGWQRAHEPKKAGSDAMNAEQYRELVEKVDGNNRRAA